MTFPFFSGILTVLKVRDETKQTEKNMKNDKSNKWTSYNEISKNAELPARVQRLKRHNKILTLAIAAMVGIAVPLFFTALIIACA